MTTPARAGGCARTAGFGAIALAAMLSAGAAPASALAPDPAEQAAYQSALNLAEPGPRAAAMEAFAARYPSSAVKIDALEQAMAARQTNNEPDKVDEDARRILALQPENARALAIDVVLIRAKAAGPTTPQTKAYADAAAAEAEKGLKALPAWKPPAGAAAAEAADMRSQMIAAFNGALGFRSLIRGDYAAAKPFYEAALKADPIDLNNTYQYAVSLMQADPIDPAGFWWAARAFDLAQSQGVVAASRAIEANAKARFIRYHGTDQGWDVLIAQAAVQTAPPPGFAVRPAPSPAELAVLAAQGGSLSDLSLSDWEFILAQRDASPANQAAAAKVWKEIVDFQARGAQLRLPIKVLAVSSAGLDGAILPANQAAGAPDLHLTFAQPPPAPPTVGSMISVVGVLTDFSTRPFAFTMDRASIAAGP